MDLESRKVRKYLNHLVKYAELKRLTKDNLLSFKDELEKWASNIEGDLLEYRRNRLFLGFRNKWKVIEVNDLDLKIESYGSDLIYLSGKNKDITCFRHQGNEVAFLDNLGLYKNYSTPEIIFGEYVYLPKISIEQLFK